MDAQTLLVDKSISALGTHDPLAIQLGSRRYITDTSLDVVAVIYLYRLPLACLFPG